MLKYFGNFSASLAIGEMQMKTTLRFHLRPLEWSDQKQGDNKHCHECGERATYSPLGVEAGIDTMKSVCSFLDSILLQRCLLIHIYCGCIHNSQEVEIA